MNNLIFLKLGGSLITDKTRPYTPRLELLADLAAQIAMARESIPGLTLVLGHGSGSFGHTAAKEYKTRDGDPHRPAGTSPKSDCSSSDLGEAGRGYWRGFAEVWFQASALNRFVMEALHGAGIPALALAPVAAVTASDGKISQWDLTPLKTALANGLIPVVYGDVIFDTVRGGTILSTEDLFAHLAQELHPQRILLAGLEGGVWADFPTRSQLLDVIDSATYANFSTSVGEAMGADVTGGMREKVRLMLSLCTAVPDLTVRIFSGEEPEALGQVLHGEALGTLIRK